MRYERPTIVSREPLQGLLIPTLSDGKTPITQP